MGEEAAGPIDGDAGGLFSHGDYTAANCSSFASGGCGSYPSGGVPLARLDQAHVPQLVPVFCRRGAAARPLARTPRAGPLGGVSAHSPAYAFFCSPCLLPSLHFPLDLVSDLFPAQAVAQEHGRNGRAQGLEVLVGVPAVDLKLVRQPLRRGCEELGHAGEGIVR